MLAAAMVQEHAFRLLEPGEFIGRPDARVEVPSGVVCFIEQQLHIEPHEHTDTHFVLIVAGSYRTAARNTGDSVVGPGTVIYNPPGTRHEDQFVGPGRLVTVALSGSMVEHFDLEDCASVVPAPAAAPFLLNIAAEAERFDETSALAIEGLLLELSASSTKLRHNAAQPPPWLRLARNRIDDASEDIPTVEALAHEARVHPVYFARVFRRFVGTSPGDYVRRARARRASMLLARSRLPLSEVALECGFSDQSALCKAFVRATGLTPGAFRSHWMQR